MAFVHTTIHVTDIDRSMRFAAGDHEIAFLGDGGTKLELVADGTSGVDYPGISIGFTSGDAEALARSLDEKFVGPICLGPGVRFYMVKDPDGFTVQILQG